MNTKATKLTKITRDPVVFVNFVAFVLFVGRGPSTLYYNRRHAHKLPCDSTLSRRHRRRVRPGTWRRGPGARGAATDDRRPHVRVPEDRRLHAVVLGRPDRHDVD